MHLYESTFRHSLDSGKCSVLFKNEKVLLTCDLHDSKMTELFAMLISVFRYLTQTALNVQCGCVQKSVFSVHVVKTNKHGSNDINYKVMRQDSQCCFLSFSCFIAVGKLSENTLKKLVLSK